VLASRSIPSRAPQAGNLDDVRDWIEDNVVKASDAWYGPCRGDQGVE
jgi:hypothetical protein